MPGGGASLLTWAAVQMSEDVWGRTPTAVWDLTIASGTYPTNGYTLDPVNWGQLNRFKTIVDVYFVAKTVATLGIVWSYDIVNKSVRAYQQGAGAGALAELSGTVGPFQLRCRFLGF